MPCARPGDPRSLADERCSPAVGAAAQRARPFRGRLIVRGRAPSSRRTAVVSGPWRVATACAPRARRRPSAADAPAPAEDPPAPAEDPPAPAEDPPAPAEDPPATAEDPPASAEDAPAPAEDAPAPAEDAPAPAEDAPAPAEDAPAPAAQPARTDAFQRWSGRRQRRRMEWGSPRRATPEWGSWPGSRSGVES